MMPLTVLLALTIHPACLVEADHKMGGAAASYYQKSYVARVATCQIVAAEADRVGLGVPTAAVLSWEESNWQKSLVHPRTRVMGPLQVATRWWCPGGRAEGCDLVAAGVRAVSYYMHDHKEGRLSRVLGLCHYNAGNVCFPRSLRRARYIDAEIRRVEQRLRPRPRPQIPNA